MSMQTSSRRAVIATTLAGLVGGCAPVAFASTSPDAELLRAGADFDRLRAEQDAVKASRDAAASVAAFDDPDVRELGFLADDMCATMEEAADRVMAIQPKTLAGLALWARMMCWRFDADLRGVVAQPPASIAEYGVNEAFALAAAIERMASSSTEQSS